MRKISAMAIMVVMLLPVLCVLPVNDAKAENVKADVESGESVETSLYFYNESRMNTTLPPSGDVNTSSLKDKESVKFNSPELREDLIVNASKCCNITFYIEIKLNYPAVLDSVVVNLNFSLTNSNLHATGKDSIGETSGTEGVKKRTVSLNVEEEGEVELKKNSDISLTISSSVFPHGENKKYLYEITLYYGVSDRDSHLSFYSSPVTLVTYGTYDYNDKECQEFKPNPLSNPIIIFKGNIKDAFGDEDLKEVEMNIKYQDGSSVSPLDIKGLKTETGDYECKWDYTNNSPTLKAGEYVANLSVTTQNQHTFYQTTSFTFIGCALDSWTNYTAPATILVGKSASYAITIRNTGSFNTKVTINISFDIQVIPLYTHLWNVSVFDKDKGKNVGSVDTNASKSLFYNVDNFGGGDTKNLILTVSSIDTTIGTDWKCRVDVNARSTDPNHPAEAPSLTLFTKIAAPYEINGTWIKKDNYVLVNTLYQFEINVTNLGANVDAVKLTFRYTNEDIWNITFIGYPVQNVQNASITTSDLNPQSSAEVVFNVMASDISKEMGEAPTVINITAESVRAPPEYKANYTNKTLKYLPPLEVKRAFGIKMDVELKGTGKVDVKDSDGKEFYDISIKTNDNTKHIVDLTAVPDNKNITTSFNRHSVSVSKDSPANVTLTVTCLQGMLARSYNIMVNASIRGAPVPEHNRTENVTVTVKPFPALTVVWADTNKNEITVIAKPGEYIHKTLKVKNEGNSKITVDLTPKATSSKYGLSITFSPSSQFDLSPKEEKNITLILGVPEDAKDGETLVGEIEITSPGLNKVATILIEIKQSELEKLMATLYSMIYFIILLITVIVVFIAVWVKKRRKIE